MRRSNIIGFISGFVVVTAIILAMLSERIGAVVSSLITTLITTVGAVVVWIQLKQSGEKVSTELIENLNTVFLKSDGLVYLRDKLKKTNNPKDFTLDGKQGKKDTTKDLDNFIQDDSVNIIEYLEFFENIGVIYESGTINMRALDNCFGEAFFVALNNKYIQERELIPYKEHYTTILRLYKVWFNYRKKRNLAIAYEEDALGVDKLLKEDK